MVIMVTAVMAPNPFHVTRPANALSSKQFRLRSAACAGLLPALLMIPSPLALASEWKITPSVSASETYTDNVSLGTSNPQSDWVTQINPGVSVAKTGKRLKINAIYTLQNLFYANDNSRDNTYHQLSANGNAELLEQALFVDATASIRQQATSLLSPTGTNNINTGTNLTNVRTLSLSPYLEHRFGAFAKATVRYSHDETRTGQAGLSNSSADRVTGNLSSGSSFNDLTWGLDYS